MIDIEQLKLTYFQNDEPCPYKLKCGYELKIYPIKVKDWSIFDKSLDILQIEKNEINDIKIIQMSYLDFLNYLISNENDKISIYGQKLADIFLYSIKEQNVGFIKTK
jgi:hypothetical protein